jgi:hypothetical protein
VDVEDEGDTCMACYANSSHGNDMDEEVKMVPASAWLEDGQSDGAMTWWQRELSTACMEAC